jgi:hypothetical protein
MDSLIELFCDVDDFCKGFLPKWQQLQLSSGLLHRQRRRSLCMSEIMTILIAFHQSHYRNFKAYYCEQVLPNWRSEFPGLVSYSRFVEFTSSAMIPLAVYLRERGFGHCTGISFIDSTALAVCHNARIHQNRVFAGLAERGHTSTGWFFGFKLHLVVNDQGELLNALITPGNIDDRKPMKKLVRQLFGKLFGDKGYLSQPLIDELLKTFNLHLITKLRGNMKNRLLPLFDALMLRKRAIIESVIDQLKNISQIEHSRHRSPFNFVVNVLCGLIAYCRRSKKPSLGLGKLDALPA